MLSRFHVSVQSCIWKVCPPQLVLMLIAGHFVMRHLYVSTVGHLMLCLNLVASHCRAPFSSQLLRAGIFHLLTACRDIVPHLLCMLYTCCAFIHASADRPLCCNMYLFPICVSTCHDIGRITVPSARAARLWCRAPPWLGSPLLSESSWTPYSLFYTCDACMHAVYFAVKSSSDEQLNSLCPHLSV